MSSSYQLKPMKFLLFFILLLIFQRPIRAEDPIVTLCPAESSNFTSGSQFETNLNILLPNLSTNGLLNIKSFYNTSYGDDPNKIYGFSQCMSEASEDTCRSCLVDGSTEITKLCTKKREASVLFYNCVLRYSYRPFFYQPSMRLYVSNNSSANSSSTSFNLALGDLLGGLKSNTLSEPSKFANQSVYISDSQNPGTLHGTAQCTRDLSVDDCGSCLQRMIDYIPTCCDGKSDIGVYTLSCNIRYNMTSQPIAPEGSGTPIAAIVIPIVIGVIAAFPCHYLFH